MTENRFGYDERIDKIWFWKDGMRYQLDVNNLEECVETLNTLNNALEMCKQENEQLKQVLGSILIEVRRDISGTNHSGEVKAFVNPNSFDLISDVLKKYGALKDWYE